MELKQAILSRRTRRKFTSQKMEHEKLVEILNYARYAPMGANIQGIKYMLIEDEKMVNEVFKNTKWSGYHPENAPTTDEQPTAYIAMLGDTSIKANGSFETDAGAAGMVITLVAEDMGIASCWLGAINREEISKLLKLNEKYKLLYLIAIGYSKQIAKAVDANGDIKYYTDSQGVLNVPKRTLDEILI